MSAERMFYLSGLVAATGDKSARAELSRLFAQSTDAECLQFERMLGMLPGTAGAEIYDNLCREYAATENN